MPLPEDLPLLFAGALCARGVCEPAAMLPMVLGVVLVSDTISYCLGRRFGHHLPRVPLLGRMLTEERLTRVEEAYHAHGKKTIFVSRFMPALRTPFFFAAGAVRIPYWRFILVDAIAAVFSVSLLVALGWAFAQHLPAVIEYVRRAKWVMWGVLGVILLALILWEWRHVRQRKRPRQETRRSSEP